MKLGRSLAMVVGIQTIGSIATLASVTLLARLRGAEIQGAFSLAKAEIDLMVALLLVGMPQAIFYYLSRGALDWVATRRLTLFHSIVAGIVAVLFASTKLAQDGAASAIVVLVGIGTAVAALVWHGNVRGGLLDAASPVVFSVVTALPGVCLLLGVVVALLAGGITSKGASASVPVIAAAYGVACVVTLLAARRQGATSLGSGRSPGLGALATYGVSTWVASVAQTLTPVVALTWIDRRIGDPVGLGVFSAAIMCLNLVLTPVAMLLPLLFKRWVGLQGASRWTEFRRALWPTGALCLGFAALVLLVQRPLVGAVFGSEYLPQVGVFALLALGLWPQTVNRLLGVMFSADGRPWMSIVGEISRVAALVIGLLLLQSRDLIVLACIWVGAEFVAPVVSLLLLQQVARRSSVTTA